MVLDEGTSDEKLYISGGHWPHDGGHFKSDSNVYDGTTVT